MNNDIWNEAPLGKKFVPYVDAQASRLAELNLIQDLLLPKQDAPPESNIFGVLVMTETCAPFNSRLTLDPDEAFRILAEVTGQQSVLQKVKDRLAKWPDLIHSTPGLLGLIAELEAEHAEKGE